jgi:hypothetical protein
MTIGIEILIGIWLCVFEIMICEYSLMNEMNKHWCSFDDKVVMVPACVVDGALKEYLRPTRGEIRCKGENLFIFRLLWS